MQAVAQGAYSEDDVLAELRGKSGFRKFSYRYELLDDSNDLIEELDGVVVDGAVTQNWLADIKRSAWFTIRDTGTIDYLSDRIKPYVRLGMPPYGSEDYVEWAQGVFLLSTPARMADSTGTVTRNVTAYDQCQVYLDDKVEDRYTVSSGTVYTTAVTTLLGSVDMAITPTTATLPADRDWDPGTPKLTIINNLLSAVNYQSLSFDESGRAVVVPYTAPSDRVSEYTYADDEDGLIIPGVDSALDLFAVPNKWVLVVSNPDQAVITSTYTNASPSSPTSTVRRGRTIVDFRTEQDAADQATLDEKAARLAFEASQVYEKITFSTGCMPVHSGNDVYTIQYGPLALNAKYSEHTWELPLRTGEPMRHTARRVVSVG